MKKVVLILLALALFLAVSAAAEGDSSFLGKPFPDFTVTDTEGNTFTLSEKLKDHEAVKRHKRDHQGFPREDGPDPSHGS